MNEFLLPEASSVRVISELFLSMNEIDQLKEKISCLPSCSRFSDNQIEIIYSIAHSTYSQGKLDTACGIFQMLLMYRPLDARILCAFGICCKRLGRFEEAITAFSAALTLEPTKLNYYMHLAECLAAAGMNSESLEVLDPLIDVSSLTDSFKAVHNRATTMREMLRQAS
jgi:type III secretion system low calcium response chaperone LcrH/SycD